MQPLQALTDLGGAVSRSSYDETIAQGRHPNQAVLWVARCRAGVLSLMLRDGTFYESRPGVTVS